MQTHTMKRKVAYIAVFAIAFAVAGFALWLGIQIAVATLGFIFNNPAATLVIVASFFAASYIFNKIIKA